MTHSDSRLLLPQEHGTYGEILFPLLTALAVGRPGPVAWALVAAAVGGYLAHEGAIVLLGFRGVRARRERRAAAVRSLLLFGGVGVLGGILGWILAEGDVRVATVLSVTLSLAALSLAWGGYERSAAGEILAGVALASWGIPVAVAAGAGWVAALVCWAVWVITFSAATLAVRAVIARAKRRSPWPSLLGVGALAAAAVAGVWHVAATDAVPTSVLWALVPTAALVLLLSVGPIPAQRLKMIGWSLMAASLATFAVLTAVFR
jgi:hypothetical protein